MKLKYLFVIAIVALVAFSFTNKAVDFKVDKTRSKVSWIGRKVTGEHSGNINVADGNLSTDGKTITGGSFDIDMNSMTCTDITDAEYSSKLIGHLKSEDFFSTIKFPKSTLIITKVTAKGNNQYNIAGNLTIKGITKPIEFPATVVAGKDQIKATAKILVDRTKYDVRYGSKSFFDGLGDKAIDDQFELNVDLIAKK